MWSDNAVHRILTSETYAGVWWYGRRIGHDGKGGKRPKKDQVPVPVPPIVSRELWAAAQEKRKYNKRMSRRNCKREYLLQGRIKCECGYSMHGKWEYTGRPKYYYRCGEGRHRHTGLEEKKCDRLVRGDLLDTLVWEFVLDVMTDRERFEQGLIDAQEAERDALRPKRERLALVEEMIDNCGKEAEKLVQALKNVSGGIVEAALQRDIDAVNQQYEALVRERDELLESLEAEELSDEDIAAALAFREAVLAGMQNPTFEDKRRTLEDLRVQVKLFDRERAEVTCRIPRASTVITLVTSKDVKLPLTAELGLRYNASVCRR